MNICKTINAHIWSYFEQIRSNAGHVDIKRKQMEIWFSKLKRTHVSIKHTQSYQKKNLSIRGL